MGLNLNSSFFIFAYRKYLNNIFEKYQITDIIENLMFSFDNVYIFSGVTRDFFLGKNKDPKDLDIVVSDDITNDNFKTFEDDFEMAEKINDLEDFINVYLNKSNKKHNALSNDKLSIFKTERRGYCDEDDYSSLKVKLNQSKFSIDLWDLRSSFGYMNSLNTIPYKERNAKNLIKTPFFNCSAICFDYKKLYFYYDKNFEEFLEKKQLSIVNEINSNKMLQMKKMINYSLNLDLTIDDKLKDFFKSNYDDLCSQLKKLEIDKGMVKDFMIKNKI